MNKFGAKRTEFKGRMFDSRAEQQRAIQLEMLMMAGDVRNVEYQPSFDLVVNGVKVGRYVADFRYVDVATGRTVVEDVKGVKTPVYRLKAKLVKALYGVEVQEITT